LICPNGQFLAASLADHAKPSPSRLATPGGPDALTGFASSFLNCLQNGFNYLLRAKSSWISFGHTLVRRGRTFISTCASRNIGTAAREGHAFRENVTSADGEALSHFGSGYARLGFRFWSSERSSCFIEREVGCLFATAAAGRGFLDGLSDCFPGFAGALLNAAQEFIVLAFSELEIVIRKLGPLLFQLALRDVPIAFDFECVHNSLYFVFRL
jgi:hypothetical protein